MSKYNAKIPSDLLDLMDNKENGETVADSKETVVGGKPVDTKNKVTF